MAAQRLTRQLAQLRVYKVTLVEEEEQMGMQPASPWLVVETSSTKRRRRWASAVQPDGEVLWEEQHVDGPSRGRVLSQAVCTDVADVDFGVVSIETENHGVLAGFRRAAAPETFRAPSYPVDLDLAPGQPGAVLKSHLHVRSAAEYPLPGCIYIPNVLDGEECAAWCQGVQGKLKGDRVDYAEYQKRSRYNFSNQALAAELFLRVLSAIRDLEIIIDAEGACWLRYGESGEIVEICPNEFRLDPSLEGVWSVKGLHDYLRVVKYPKGGFLAKHCDAMYSKSDNERSFFTVLLYLTDLTGADDGGSTRFLKTGQNAAIHGSGPFEEAHEDEVVYTLNPKMGDCLIFFQPGLLHEGEELRAEEKYILRSDVMFQRVPSPEDHVA